ncbi:MAG: sugar ABC transporter substrate-binding protein [Christensenellaceae bacterium]|nr:sugar ABC transporter substrate-binding protein [Christensenellaceae bacterium]MEA5069444.1 sugar ABC transporter substrate-binding protein [Christensenellaceae bacterium]
MKKAFRALLIALVLSILMTTAASPVALAEAPVKLTFWTFHSSAEKDFMASLPEQYMKEHPGVEIEFVVIPQDEYMSSKLTTAFAAGAGPDVFFMSPGDFLKYANSSLAMDLTPYFTPELLDDFLPSSIEAVTVDGKICAIPFEVELLGLYYNKDMLSAAGIAPPATWDELIAATSALTKDKIAGLLIEPNKGYYQNFTWYPFLWQGGANAVDVEKKQASFDNQAAVDALKLWGDLIKAGAPSKISIPGTFDISLLGTGQAAMQVSGTWAIADLEKKYADQNIGVVPLPVAPGGKPATCAGGWKVMVNANSAHADEAAKFAMWCFAGGVDNPLKWCTDVKFAYSPRKSVVEAGKDIYSKGLRQVFTDEIYDTAIGEPRYPAEVVDAIGNALQNVMFADADPAAEAKTANEQIDLFLQSFQGSM